MTNKPATLRGVAESAGVSTATVARVLKKQDVVSEDTRLRVEKALKKTGYRLNGVARGLRTNRTLTIGNFLRGSAAISFFIEIARGIEEEAIRNDYTVIMLNPEGSHERERLGVERLIERRVDAMIFTPAQYVGNIDIASAAGIPVVQVERILNRPTSAVIVDNFSGCVQAIEHLVQLGHRRIGFIGGDKKYIQGSTGPISLSVEEQRLAGYRQGLENAGLGYHEELVRLGPYISAEEPVTRYGREGMRHLLELKNPPTAVFATSDVLAAGALQVAYQSGLRIPTDISIIGYDNSLGGFLSPALTTVSQPMRAMGICACQLALAAIRGDNSPRTVTLRTELQIRRVDRTDRCKKSRNK
ncbi:LacI family DNA-binding transcriptional regulator [Bradyrhizobium sp. RDT10]